MNKRIKKKKKLGNKISFNRYYKCLLKQLRKHLKDRPDFDIYKVYIDGKFLCDIKKNAEN